MATYGIFAFEFQSPQLKWIRKEIKINIEEKVRDNICVIDTEDLGLHTLDTIAIFNKLKKIINDNIESFKQAKLKPPSKEINALEFWKSKVEPKRKSEKPSAAKAAARAKAASKPGAECSLQGIKYKSSAAKIISKLRTQQNYLITEKIEDGPDFGVELYIVLLGFSKVDIYFSLLENNLKLMAIIYFYNLWEEADIDNQVLALKNSDKTKNINISTQYMPSLSKYKANKYRKQISNEFYWYLYDLEHKRTEYESYLNNLDILDVGDIATPSSVFEAIKQLQIPDLAPDEIVVLIYLDSLFNLSCGDKIKKDNNINEQIQDIYYLNRNDQNLILFHNDNCLLKMIYASEMENDGCDNIINFAKFSSLTYNLELLSNSIELISNIDTFESQLQDGDCYYLQQFNKDVFFQNVNALLCNFDKIFYSIVDANVIVFGQYKDGLNCECDTMFVVPNKICFRDFCYYISQNMENMLGNISSSKTINNTENMKFKHLLLSLNFIRLAALKSQYPDNFSTIKLLAYANVKDSMKTVKQPKLHPDKLIVYNLSDTQLQITFTECYYRSMCIGVSCYFDKWLDGSIFTRINTRLFENNIYYNKKYLGQRNNAIRLITKYGIVIDLSYKHDNSESYDILITWPNKLYISAYLINGIIIKVEQNSIKEYNKEEKREFIEDGTVIIFYKNNLVTILRPNGTIYCTNVITKNLEKECKQPSYLDYLYTKYTDEINYIKNYNYILDSKNFSITTADGINFEIENNIIKQKFQNYFVNEWIDFVIGAIYVHREDEVKLVYTEEYLECNYPDGTCIKSYMDAKILFDFDDIEEFSEDYEAYEIIRAILDIIINYTAGDVFTTLEISNVTEHVNYAQTLSSYKNLKITCPQQLHVEVTENNINVELEDKISIIYNSNNCTISSNNSIQDICDFKININFDETDELLYDLNESGIIFQITHKSSCQLFGSKEFPNNEPGSITKSKLLNFENYGGSESSKMDEHATELQTVYNKQKRHIYNNKEDGYECLIFPLKKYEDIFKMPVNNVENLKRFEKSYFIFKNSVIDTCLPIFICQTDGTNPFVKDCSPVFTFRVFFQKCKDYMALENTQYTQSLENDNQLSAYGTDSQFSKDSSIRNNEQHNVYQENISGYNSLKNSFQNAENNSLKNSMQNASGDDKVKFIDFQDILYKTVEYLENECKANEKKMMKAKQNALDSKLMNYELQKFGIRNLQKLVLCNVYPQYFDFVGNYETLTEGEDLVELYLKYRLPKK